MVDADTAAVVFDKCILKALRGRTVIMTTHQVQVGAKFQAERFISFVSVVRLIHSNCCTLGYCMKVVIRLACKNFCTLLYCSCYKVNTYCVLHNTLPRLL
jgi:hypothetical protein